MYGFIYFFQSSDIGSKYDMEINIDKSQVMRVSRSNESLQIKVNNRELKEVDHFKLPLSN